MAFGDFKNLGEVALMYQVTVRPEPFVQPVAMTVGEAFRRRLGFNWLNAPIHVSDEAICEFLIAPILQELWRSYSDSLMIWSHVPFGKALPLMGRASKVSL